jgi:type I restriction enzyme M protein
LRQPDTPRDSVSKLNQSNESNFFASGLRQKVDQLMNVLWAGGVNNPMDSIEQLSYLIFLLLLSERDDQAAVIEKGYQRIFSGQWARYAWGNFVTLTGNELFDTLRGAIERLHELPGLSDTGRELFRNATLKIYDRPTLRAVVQIIAQMDLAPHEGHDLKGDMYEYLLSKLSQSGTNGQFRTPRHIIDLIVALVDPQPGLRICDPACGTAGFLISAYRYILRSHTKPTDRERGAVDGSLLKPSQWEFLERHAFTGFDNDANMVKISILNLYLHQLEHARIEHRNPLTTTQNGEYPGPQYDVILANPPFAGRVQKESILTDINLDTRDTELLFLKWFLDHLTDTGRAGVIVPNGVLFGSGKADRKVRDLLLTICDLQAVIALPSGVFKPYSGVGTAILIFQRRRTSDSVWFYELTADGLSLDDKRMPIAANDIPDILTKWPGRDEGPNSFRVPIEKIRENGWQLMPGRYRPMRLDVMKHDAPADILGRYSDRNGDRRAGESTPGKDKNVVTKWLVKPILEACDLVGTRVSAFAGTKQYVSTGEVESSRLVDPLPVTYVARPSRADLSVQVGDVLFARMQATDKVVLINGETAGHLWSTGFAALRPKMGTDARWVQHWLRSEPFMERKDALCTGATQKAITNDGIRELTIPLPPLSEQERIVNILDEAEALRRLRKQALARTDAAIPALFDQVFGDPTTNPKGLPITKLGDIATLERGRFTPRPRNDPSYFGGAYPFIQTGDISESGGLLSSWKQTLNERGKAVSKEFPAGTIVIAIVGATIGATAILQIPVYCTDSIVGIRVESSRCLPEYVEFVLRARRPLLLAQAPDAARANINLEILREIQMPLAPLASQQDFVDRTVEIQRLQAAQAVSRKELDELFRALMHAAFQGDL